VRKERRGILLGCCGADLFRPHFRTRAASATPELARPHIANAAAATAAEWWVQGFAQEEDVSFKKIVADYEKTSGNTIDSHLFEDFHGIF